MKNQNQIKKAPKPTDQNECGDTNNDLPHTMYGKKAQIKSRFQGGEIWTQEDLIQITGYAQPDVSIALRELCEDGEITEFKNEGMGRIKYYTGITPEIEMEPTELEKSVFKFLDELRESGTTNMFGATSDVQEEFDLEKRHAKNLLIKWMESYNG